jgi:hypothetical protein
MIRSIKIRAAALALLTLSAAGIGGAQTAGRRFVLEGPSRLEVRQADQQEFEATQHWLGAMADEVATAVAQEPEDPATKATVEYAYSAYGKPAKFPLTADDKFHLFIRDTYDPFGLVGEAGQALYEQGLGVPYEYGGGVIGFSKRFGATIGTDVAGEFFGTWLFPSALHTDPRYFRMARGSNTRRTVYALTRILIVKKDTGGNTFNWANFLGGFATTSISNLYYPHRNRDLGPTLERATVNIGYDALYNLFREFWPDFAHAIHVPAFVVRRTVDPVFPAKATAAGY